MCSVHLQVIDHALVDDLRLRYGHPANPVSPGELAACGDRAVAPDGDPRYVQSGKNLSRLVPAIPQLHWQSLIEAVNHP
jgi:hypothetical protein